jgi:hypothetical protein
MKEENMHALYYIISIWKHNCVEKGEHPEQDTDPYKISTDPDPGIPKRSERIRPLNNTFLRRSLVQFIFWILVPIQFVILIYSRR